MHSPLTKYVAYWKASLERRTDHAEQQRGKATNWIVIRQGEK